MILLQYVLSKLSYHCERTGGAPCLVHASGSIYLTFSPWFGPDGPAGENVAKQGQIRGIFLPNLAATSALVGVVVEQRMKLAAAAVAWEAATKISLALSLFSPDERPTAGAGVAAAVVTAGAGIAAAGKVLLLVV